MIKRKLTQKETIFYILYKSRKESPERYVPVFEFIGETYCPELGVWGFVSHECSARASEMQRDNPELIKRDKIRGKSGARYYGYRLSLYAKPEMILDEKLREFHKRLKPKNS